MATVTVFNAARMQEIEDTTVVGGFVDVNGNLLLETRAGDEINAGHVVGPQGATGPQGPQGPQGVPGNDVQQVAGVVQLFSGSVPPSGWMICNGAAISRTTYSALFAAIGTTYGAGDGSTTFNIPDFRGRLPMGVNPGDSDYGALNAAGGAKTNTHNHWTLFSNDGSNVFGTTSPNAPRSRTATKPRAVLTGGSASGATREDSTYDETISILPPFRAIHYIISLGIIGGGAGGGSPIPIQYVGRGGIAERDALFGVPTTIAQIVALANQKVMWFNTDYDWWESYYAVSGSSGLVAPGLVSSAPAGWYPSGQGPYISLRPTVTSFAAAAGNPVRDWNGVQYRKGGASWFSYNNVNGRVAVSRAGRYQVQVHTVMTNGSGTPNFHVRVLNAGAYEQHIDGIAVTLNSSYYVQSQAFAEILILEGREVDLYCQAGTLSVHMGSVGSTIKGEFLVRYVGPPLVSD